MPIPNGSVELGAIRPATDCKLSRNDILRKHKIIPEKPPSPTPIILEAIEKAREQAYEDRLEDKDLDELNALEDEEDEEFLQKYRWVLKS